MRNFFLEEIPLPGELVELSDPEARHASVVLRLKTHALIGLLDGKGTRATATVASASRRNRLVCMIDSKETLPLPEKETVLYISPPRNKQMHMIVRQCVELGVRRIVPVICERSVALPTAADKPEKWLDEAVAACKQSGNLFLPEILPAVLFSDALVDEPPPGIYGDCAGQTDPLELAGLLRGLKRTALWVGPEGGFSDAETEKLQGAGVNPCRLGN